jgi:hypothetical protein
VEVIMNVTTPSVPGKGWNTILRLYSLLEPFFTEAWRPSEIELVR